MRLFLIVTLALLAIPNPARPQSTGTVNSLDPQLSRSSVSVRGKVAVPVKSKDEAGNEGENRFQVQLPSAAPTHLKAIAQGEPLPDAGNIDGLPSDALVTSLGVPAIDGEGTIAFTAKWMSGSMGAGSGLFTNSRCLGVVEGSVPGIPGARFKSFADPVIADGKVVCLGRIARDSKSSSAVVLHGPATGPLAVLAESGMEAPDCSGAKFASFQGAAVNRDATTFMARLRPGTGRPKATPANDRGLWVTDTLHPLTCVLREGQSISTPFTGADSEPIFKVARTITAYRAGNGSPGQGRGWLTRIADASSYLSGALTRVRFADGTQQLLSGLTENTQTQYATSGRIRPFEDADGQVIYPISYASFGVPAVNQNEQYTFRAALIPSRPVTRANAQAIYFLPSNADDLVSVARAGEDAPGTDAKFRLLKDPVLAGDGGIAFPASIKGRSVKALESNTLWWRRPSGTLRLLAQGGTSPADLPDARWGAFPSLAIASNRGPLFIGTLVPGRGGVTKGTARGVWAQDSTGTLRLLFRAGVTQIDLGGTAGVKTVKRFTLLNATVGSTGVTRSFNDIGDVVWLATFADKSQAIVISAVP